MILVTGSILAREEAFDEVLRACLEHVERSRKEPGCISHDVHVDCQNPMRLFFFEQWGGRGGIAHALRGRRLEGVRKIPQGPYRRNLGDQNIPGGIDPEMIDRRGRLRSPVANA